MNIFKFSFFLALCVALTSCQKDESPQASLQLPSLKDNLPILMTEAVKWDKDAYLYSATLPISGSVSTWKINAVFSASAKPDNSIVLRLSENGTIEMDTINYTMPIPQRKPILDSDWQIDSYEALDILMKNDTSIQEFLNASHEHCSDIKLERFTPAKTQPVVWSLALFDCGSKSEYYYLDPITGELLNLSRSEIPDAILITPYP